MKRVSRLPLPVPVAANLQKLQAKADSGLLDVNRTWKNAAKSVAFRPVKAQLSKMFGSRERCAYCVDSHGSDIEHFWPKVPYSGKMFLWENLLLCCTECGRFKGNQFPVDAGIPLLIDPTFEDPWAHLDFDPATGNIVARYIPELGGTSPKGRATAEMFQLAEREALSNGRLRAWHHLVKRVHDYLAQPSGDLAQQLLAGDDYGLFQWSFLGTGRMVEPLSQLFAEAPTVWHHCEAIAKS